MASSANYPRAIQKLTQHRTKNTRNSREVFKLGISLLDNGRSSMGDDYWAFLEQLALAAVDIGRLYVAEDCIARLSSQFPDSPRIALLRGIVLESTSTPEMSLRYYDGLLTQDESNGAAWKQRIGVLRRSGKVQEAVEELTKFLDTFYTDAEGWLELADMYSSCHQYTLAQQALAHAQLIAPHNVFYTIQAAETAYTSSDIPLALKLFLTVAESADDSMQDDGAGLARRAWYGTKLCTRRLLETSGAGKSSSGPKVGEVKLLDELATERLLALYSSKESDWRNTLLPTLQSWLTGTSVGNMLR